MSDSERAENPSASARSTHVAHFMPPAWPIVASRLAPLIARVDRDAEAVQVLILVPTAPDATALFRALSDLDIAGTASMSLLATPRRSRRLTSAAKAQVVVGTPAVVHGLVSASALSLAAVTGVGIVAADELESDSPVLDLVLAELPRGAAKTLIATSPSAFVDRLIEAQMHGARRLPAAAAEPGTIAAPPIEYIPTSAESPAATLGDVLEIVDAPSAAVVPADSAREQAARAALASLGYPPDSPLARVARDGASGGAALVVLMGAPNTEQWAAVMAAPPARVVALVTTRERSALAGVVPGARLVPFSPSGARGDAAAAEEALRDRIRRSIVESYPAREMLALEPLLGQFDALVLAGAALRMFERER